MPNSGAKEATKERTRERAKEALKERAFTEREIKLLSDWFSKIADYNVGCLKARNFYRTVSHGFRASAVLLPLLATITQYAFPENVIIPTICSFLSAVCLGLQARIRPGDQEKSFHYSMCRFRALETKMKDLCYYSTVMDPKNELRRVRKKYDEVLAGTPMIPMFLMQAAKREHTYDTLKVLGHEVVGDSDTEAVCFTEAQEQDLYRRRAQAAVNRQECLVITQNAELQWVALGVLNSTCVMIAACMSFVKVIDWCQSEGGAWLPNGYMAVNSAAAALSAVEGAFSLDQKHAVYKNASERWSSYGRQIEELLDTQPHMNPHSKARHVEDAVKDFVDELLALNLHFTPKHDQKVVDAEAAYKDDRERGDSPRQSSTYSPRESEPMLAA